MDFVLIVMGAIVGALSTGGVALVEAARRRTVERRVAARLILGDLYVIEAAADVILKTDRWPDRMDLRPALETWREARAPFAAAVQAWEWALVDGCFSNLHRTLPMVRAGEPTTTDDVSVVEYLRQTTVSARAVVLPRAAKPAELDRMVEKLQEHATETA